MMTMQDRLAWFDGKKWGLFSHYLAAPASSAEGAAVSAAEWNRQVDQFDVDLFARQACACGVPYFCITIGQNSGHYCSPNATYDRLTGIYPSKCSRRDLVADLADALARYGIDLLVYLPSGAPAAEPQAISSLEWEWGFEGAWPHCHSGPRTGKRLAAFQQKWEAIIREWSLRWGDKVKGWWIDGCYFFEEMYNFPDEPNYDSFAGAIRAGNPAALLAMNTGLEENFTIVDAVVDFSAGEVGYELPLAIAGDDTAAGMQQKLNGRKLHVLSFLGKLWGQGEPRFPDLLVAGYTRYINERGGVVTWDIRLESDGTIPVSFQAQLASLNRLIDD